MAETEDWRAVNRANWDERVPIHLAAETCHVFYPVVAAFAVDTFGVVSRAACEIG